MNHAIYKYHKQTMCIQPLRFKIIEICASKLPSMYNYLNSSKQICRVPLYLAAIEGHAELYFLYQPAGGSSANP
jgi:hypothetical protein